MLLAGPIDKQVLRKKKEILEERIYSIQKRAAWRTEFLETGTITDPSVLFLSCRKSDCDYWDEKLVMLQSELAEIEEILAQPVKSTLTQRNVTTQEFMKMLRK
jgi:hypothetical protein